MIVAPTDEAIRRAAEALLRGELVGMPTETVYGLAAVATSPGAIRRIFEVKGRPSDNPLIVHLASIDDLESVAEQVPLSALQLAERFWPGPLTLVLPKRKEIPSEVTAGLSTVAVRVPAHPVARDLIRAVGKPLAAPSANRFMALSPTRAQDIDPLIANQLFCIIDGGPCSVGIESTVVQCLPEIAILRPGGVSRDEIEAIMEVAPNPTLVERRSPGQYPRHYAPATAVRLVAEVRSDEPGLVFGVPTDIQVAMPRDPVAYASRLYGALRLLDHLGLDAIYVEAPPETDSWEAVWDRLRKASTID